LLTTISGNAKSCIAQPDGKIIIGGYGNYNSVRRYKICRVLNNGNMDSTFGNNGVVIDSFFHTQHDEITSLVLQPDGKIITVGRSDSFTTFYMNAARYLADGKPDSSFGNYGQLLLPQTTYGSAMDAVLQPDGKIIIAGSNNGFGLVRLTNNGTLDNSFGANGFVSTSVGTAYYSGANTICLQADGKILVAGNSYHNTYYWAAIGRYNANGTIDNTFGTNGIAEYAVRGYYDDINDILQQADGKIICAGSSTINSSGSNPATTAFMILRLDTLGQLDNSFNGNGQLIKSIGTRTDKCFQAILQNDGKIIIGGYSTNANINLDFAICRLLPNGSDDNTFGNNGTVTSSFYVNGSYLNDYGQSMCMQPDGKLVIAGYSVLSGPGNFSAMRFNNANTLGIAANNKNTSAFISLYPNPSTNKINMQSSIALQDASLHIINQLGQVVMQHLHFNGNDLVLPIDHLAKGIYTVKITDKNVVSSMQIEKL
jgi:uncharacterized delta-60 repeat protein